MRESSADRHAVLLAEADPDVRSEVESLLARETQWYAGKPEAYLSFGLQAANRNVLGQRRESGKLYKRAAETAQRRGLRKVAADFEEADARADALSGNCRTARQLGWPALPLAICGDTAQAEKLAGETSKLFSNGTVWNAVELPAIRAAIDLQRGQPAKAVELLASASPYERAYPAAVYMRGLAYLRLRKGAEAAAEFRKIVDHKGASWGSTWLYPNRGLYYSISYVGLARGSALAGDNKRPPGKPSRTSSNCGRTPTPTSRYLGKRKRSTPACGDTACDAARRTTLRPDTPGRRTLSPRLSITSLRPGLMSPSHGCIIGDETSNL